MKHGETTTSGFAVWLSVLLLLLPSLHPTNAACLTTLNELAQAEATVTDVSNRRTYTLCPNTRFVVGRYDYSYHLVDGQDPLVVRPNLYVKCGDDGQRSNQCLLLFGDILVTDAAVDEGDNANTVGPIILQGLTLEDPARHFVKLTHPYKVRFVDCVFRQSRRAWVPLLLDYYQPNNAKTQHVLWHGCDFEENSFPGAVAQPSLIVATNHQVSLALHGCRFTNNDFATDNTIADRNSFLIDASGPLELVGNCFAYNAVGVSPAVSYHADVNSVGLSENFAEVSRGQVCPFVSHFRTAWQYQTDSPYCHDFDVTTCQADSMPSFTVTEPPTFGPTKVPTIPPSALTTTRTLTEIPTPRPTLPLSTVSPTRHPPGTTEPTIATLPAEPFRSGARVMTLDLCWVIAVFPLVFIAYGGYH